MTPEDSEEARKAMIEIAMDDMRLLGVVIYDGSEARFCPFPAFSGEHPVVRADHMRDMLSQIEADYNALVLRGLAEGES